MAINRGQATGFILSAIIVAAVAAYLLIGTQTGFPPGGQGYKNPYPGDGSGGGGAGGSLPQSCCVCSYTINQPPNAPFDWSYKTTQKCTTIKECGQCPTGAKLKQIVIEQGLDVNLYTDPTAQPATYSYIDNSRACTGSLPCSNDPIPAPKPDGGGGGGAGGNPPPAKDLHCNCLYSCTSNSGKLSTASYEGYACGAMGADCTSTCSAVLTPLPKGMKSCVINYGTYVGSECA